MILTLLFLKDTAVFAVSFQSVTSSVILVMSQRLAALLAELVFETLFLILYTVLKVSGVDCRPVKAVSFSNLITMCNNSGRSDC